MNLQENIRKVLTEWYAKINREEESGLSYSAMEMVLNKTMTKKYDWWKKIEIYDVLYSEISDTISFYGKIYVDEDWVKQRWLEYRGYKLTNKVDYITLDDIVDQKFRKELSDSLVNILKSLTNYREVKKIRLEPCEIIPI
jgi:hypothetical protein